MSCQTGPGTLVQKAATLAKICWQREEVFNSSQDKIIIYCQTREAAGELGQILNCPVYTSTSSTATAKAAIITSWLADPSQPAIAATSALGLGFDYPYIR
jgi:superfamily II DNA helicase RecQ